MCPGELHGKNIIFLGQVDDFLIATQDKKLADSFLDVLDSNLKHELKRQGLNSKGPTDPNESANLQLNMCFKHRQAIG